MPASLSLPNISYAERAKRAQNTRQPIVASVNPTSAFTAPSTASSAGTAASSSNVSKANSSAGPTSDSTSTSSVSANRPRTRSSSPTSMKPSQSTSDLPSTPVVNVWSLRAAAAARTSPYMVPNSLIPSSSSAPALLNGSASGVSPGLLLNGNGDEEEDPFVVRIKPRLLRTPQHSPIPSSSTAEDWPDVSMSLLSTGKEKRKSPEKTKRSSASHSSPIAPIPGQPPKIRNTDLQNHSHNQVRNRTSSQSRSRALSHGQGQSHSPSGAGYLPQSPLNNNISPSSSMPSSIPLQIQLQNQNSLPPPAFYPYTYPDSSEVPFHAQPQYSGYLPQNHAMHSRAETKQLRMDDAYREALDHWTAQENGERGKQVRPKPPPDAPAFGYAGSSLAHGDVGMGTLVFGVFGQERNGDDVELPYALERARLNGGNWRDAQYDHARSWTVGMKPGEGPRSLRRQRQSRGRTETAPAKLGSVAGNVTSALQELDSGKGAPANGERSLGVELGGQWEFGSARNVQDGKPKASTSDSIASTENASSHPRDLNILSYPSTLNMEAVNGANMPLYSNQDTPNDDTLSHVVHFAGSNPAPHPSYLSFPSLNVAPPALGYSPPPNGVPHSNVLDVLPNDSFTHLSTTLGFVGASPIASAPFMQSMNNSNVILLDTEASSSAGANAGVLSEGTEDELLVRDYGYGFGRGIQRRPEWQEKERDAGGRQWQNTAPDHLHQPRESDDSRPRRSYHTQGFYAPHHYNPQYQYSHHGYINGHSGYERGRRWPRGRGHWRGGSRGSQHLSYAPPPSTTTPPFTITPPPHLLPLPRSQTPQPIALSLSLPIAHPQPQHDPTGVHYIHHTHPHSLSHTPTIASPTSTTSTNPTIATTYTSHYDPSTAPMSLPGGAEMAYVGQVPVPPIPIPMPMPLSALSFPLDPLRLCLLGQLEYYLSPQNMAQDLFLRQRMDSQGWIPISLIASFKRVQALAVDVQVVKDVLKLSRVVEVRDDWARMSSGWEAFVLPDAAHSVVEPQLAQQHSQQFAALHRGEDDESDDVEGEAEGEGEEDDEEEVVFVMG